MKAIIKIIMVLAVVLGTHTGYANETVKIVPTYKMISEGDSISVTDASGKVMYRGLINRSGNLVRLFDFTQLDNGVYTVEITKDFEIEILNLQVKNKKVSLMTNSQQKVFKPVFRAEKNQLIVSKIALDSKEMKVELYFEDELIHTETVKSQENILNRVYRLDETNRGNYTAIIRTNGRVYIKNFRI